MVEKKPKKGGCYILVKAQPHRSSAYFETVCCAGVDREGNWWRQYPVPFRILNDNQKFRRWDYIDYRYTTSESDRRRESQKVIPESFEVTGRLKKTERSRLLAPLVKSSLVEADNIGASLALVRPRELKIEFKEKTPEELADEKRKHHQLSSQLSLLDQTTEPLQPCRMRFFAKWTSGTGSKHQHEYDDWETSTAYNRFERNYGSSDAEKILREKYEQEYFQAGLVLAFSTHSRRNVTNNTDNQWLLVGLIRLDEETQGDLWR